MEDGWAESAGAWIADQGEEGDDARRFVLDPPMLERVVAGGFRHALDVGCGEGRFCRLLRARGIKTVGIDPTEALLAEARRRDPAGDYRPGRAESLDYPDGSFDLVVSYLTLIDIPDLGAAIPEMARVLAPDGALLIANISSFVTAGPAEGWTGGTFPIDHYMEERADWAEWRGIRVRNWHRPLSAYMSALLGQGLVLRHFEEPLPRGGDPARTVLFRRVPWFLVMEWRKPSRRGASDEPSGRVPQPA
jgi:SAM-dependent methyltransferase